MVTNIPEVVKTEYIAGWYWAAKQPSQNHYITNREQEIRSGASIKGLKIGTIPAGALVRIDENEYYDGWKRIMVVVGYSTFVPQDWRDALEAIQANEQEREAWIDVSALSPYVDEPEPEPDPELPNVLWEGNLFGYHIVITAQKLL